MTTFNAAVEVLSSKGLPADVVADCIGAGICRSDEEIEGIEPAGPYVNQAKIDDEHTRRVAAEAAKITVDAELARARADIVLLADTIEGAGLDVPAEISPALEVDEIVKGP